MLLFYYYCCIPGLCDDNTTPSKSNLQPSIQCYVCNSVDDPKCGHPFDKTHMPLVNCSDLEYMNKHNQGLMKSEGKEVPNLCRKNIQTGKNTETLNYCSFLNIFFFPHYGFDLLDIQNLISSYSDARRKN